MGFCTLQDNQLVLFLGFVTLVAWGVQCANPQDLKYLKLVSEATEFTPKEQYDYIVVGGGTAGCPLAATLSENHSVLLLERGGTAHTNPNVMNEERVINNVIETDDKDSPAEAFTSEDGVASVRGRALGGSSLINVGIYSRADEDFFNSSGINWDMPVVKSSYEWVEETVVFRPHRLNSVQSSAKEAMLQSNIAPDNGFSVDHIMGVKITGSIFDGTGRRHGAVELLNKANPNNLKVVVHATVERVIFSRSTSSGIYAVGVIYHDSNGKTFQVGVGNKGGVILSAGSLGSTQLMLLSGVGPRSNLSSLGIPVVHDQPFVGQFMADNPRISASFVPPFALPNIGVRVIGVTNHSYMFPLSGRAPFFTPANGLAFSYPPSFPSLNISMASIIFKLARTLSSGSLRLASSTDVTVTPMVRFNYFANPIDLSHCVDAARYIGKMLDTPIMDQYKFQDQDGRRYFQYVGEPLPENLSDNGEMEQFCRTTLGTLYHYHGGCSLQKVVDSDFKVIGIDALRIVDGATFVASPGTNPQATLMMLGRYMGLKMQEERSAQGA